MKTARFASIVEKAGRPVQHLALVDPAKDRSFQSAVKTGRVMTLHQKAAGSGTDRGEIGFHPGPQRQYLIFPKSVRRFGGRTVVGIKYDELASPEIPKSQLAPPPKPPTKKKPPRATSHASLESQADHDRSHAKPKAEPDDPESSDAEQTTRPSSHSRPKRTRSAKSKTAKPRVKKDSDVSLAEKTKAVDRASAKEVTELKRTIRRAMELLEAGKQVAAFNVLKQIADR